MIRRIISASLAAILAVGVAPTSWRSRASSAVARPAKRASPIRITRCGWSTWRTASLSGTVPLDHKGVFAFASVEVDKQYLVQLFNVRENRIVCTEGPYPLRPDQLNKNDVNINCGKPVALWLLTAVAAAGHDGRRRDAERQPVDSIRSDGTRTRPILFSR